jgi:hypothetical protein
MELHVLSNNSLIIIGLLVLSLNMFENTEIEELMFSITNKFNTRFFAALAVPA